MSIANSSGNSKVNENAPRRKQRRNVAPKFLRKLTDREVKSLKETPVALPHETIRTAQYLATDLSKLIKDVKSRKLSEGEFMAAVIMKLESLKNAATNDQASFVARAIVSLDGEPPMLRGNKLAALTRNLVSPASISRLKSHYEAIFNMPEDHETEIEHGQDRSFYADRYARNDHYRPDWHEEVFPYRQRMPMKGA